MLDRFLPARADNTYRGYTLGLWIFGLVVLFRLTIALGTIFNGRTAAGQADGIPLDTFGPAAAQAVVAGFAAWGLAHVVICVLCIVVLLRYRSLVPFMFALIVFEHVARKAIYYVLPIQHTTAAPGGTLNLVMLGVMLVGLVLTVVDRAPAKHGASSAAP